MMEDVRIAIPTYNRPEMIQTATLKMIDDANIPEEMVDIWVSGESQMPLYDILPDRWRRRLMVGAKGLVENRLFAEETHYEDGQKIVWVNDDIRKVRRSAGVKSPWLIEKFSDVIKQGFDAIDNRRSHLWGLYPTDNKLWSINGPEVAHGIFYVVGSIYGIVHRRDRRLYSTFGAAKEDCERVLRFVDVDGEVTRLNRVHAKTTYYNSPEIFSGIGEVERNVSWIEATWPHMVSRLTGKKSPWPELRIHRPR